jgi:hypothetical protein
MLDQVAAAFDRQDYQTASRLLKELLKQSPHNPWVQLYVGRLQEVAGKLEAAEHTYRQLLRETTHPKLATQVRQGIKRVEERKQERRRQAIAQATAGSQDREAGFLVLETVGGEARPAVVERFATVMGLDTYAARLLVPSRGWRLYRSGPIGELRVYGQELQQAGVPAFWASLPDLQQIKVFQVQYFQADSSQAIAVCHNEHGQLGSLPFTWSEISQRVEGRLPIFEQVVDVGIRNQLTRKQQTQDYSLFCDLHLPGRQCLLRLQDGVYQFNCGVDLLPYQQPEANWLDRNTIRTNWNSLQSWLQEQLPPVPVWSDFTVFGETAADFVLPLSRLKSHIDLFRRTPSFWDPAFHLYSTLLFLRNGQGNP